MCMCMCMHVYMNIEKKDNGNGPAKETVGEFYSWWYGSIIDNSTHCILVVYEILVVFTDGSMCCVCCVCCVLPTTTFDIEHCHRHRHHSQPGQGHCENGKRKVGWLM